MAVFDCLGDLAGRGVAQVGFVARSCPCLAGCFRGKHARVMLCRTRFTTQDVSRPPVSCAISVCLLFVVLVTFWQANLVYSLQPLWSTLFAVVILKVRAERGGLLHVELHRH